MPKAHADVIRLSRGSLRFGVYDRPWTIHRVRRPRRRRARFRDHLGRLRPARSPGDDPWLQPERSAPPQSAFTFDPASTSRQRPTDRGPGPPAGLRRPRRHDPEVPKPPSRPRGPFGPTGCVAAAVSRDLSTRDQLQGSSFRGFSPDAAPPDSSPGAAPMPLDPARSPTTSDRCPRATPSTSRRPSASRCVAQAQGLAALRARSPLRVHSSSRTITSDRAPISTSASALDVAGSGLRSRARPAPPTSAACCHRERPARLRVDPPARGLSGHDLGHPSALGPPRSFDQQPHRRSPDAGEDFARSSRPRKTRSTIFLRQASNFSRELRTACGEFGVNEL